MKKRLLKFFIPLFLFFIGGAFLQAMPPKVLKPELEKAAAAEPAEEQREIAAAGDSSNEAERGDVLGGGDPTIDPQKKLTTTLQNDIKNFIKTISTINVAEDFLQQIQEMKNTLRSRHPDVNWDSSTELDSYIEQASKLRVATKLSDGSQQQASSSSDNAAYHHSKGRVEILAEQAQCADVDRESALQQYKNVLLDPRQAPQALEQFVEKATIAIEEWKKVVEAYQKSPSQISEENKIQWEADQQKASDELQERKKERASYFSSLSPAEAQRFQGASVIGFDELLISKDEKIRVKILNLNRNDYPFLIRLESIIQRHDFSTPDPNPRMMVADHYFIKLNPAIDSNAFFEKLKSSFSQVQLTFTQDPQHHEKYTVKFEPNPGEEESLPLDFFIQFEDAILAYEKPENGSQIITSAPISPAFGN